MPQGRAGLHDVRTRLFCYLPVTNEEELRAVDRFIDHLRSLGEQTSSGFGGFTHSQARPAVYRGHWWSSRQGRWMKEHIALFVIDTTLRLEDTVTSDRVEDLKGFILRTYHEEGSPQEEVWLVAHEVLRHD